MPELKEVVKYYVDGLIKHIKEDCLSKDTTYKAEIVMLNSKITLLNDVLECDEKGIFDYPIYTEQCNSRKQLEAFANLVLGQAELIRKVAYI